MCVYIYRLGEFHKIGSTMDLSMRIRNFNTLPYENGVEHVILSENHNLIERMLHRRFRHCRAKGEWFRLTAEDLTLLHGVIRADNPDDLPHNLLPPPKEKIVDRGRIRPCKPYQIYLDDTTLSRLRELADSNGRDMADEVRAALDRYMTDPERIPPAVPVVQQPKRPRGRPRKKQVTR